MENENLELNNEEKTLKYKIKDYVIRKKKINESIDEVDFESEETIKKQNKANIRENNNYDANIYSYKSDFDDDVNYKFNFLYVRLLILETMK